MEPDLDAAMRELDAAIAGARFGDAAHQEAVIRAFEAVATALQWDGFRGGRAARRKQLPIAPRRAASPPRGRA